jgi:hypothetical protein
MSKKCADGPGCTEIPLPEPNLPGFTYFLGMCENLSNGQICSANFFGFPMDLQLKLAGKG